MKLILAPLADVPVIVFKTYAASGLNLARHVTK